MKNGISNNIAEFPYYSIVQKYFLNAKEKLVSAQELSGYNINSENYKLTLRSQDKRFAHLKIIHNYHKDTIKKLRVFHECSGKGIQVAKIIPTTGGEICVETERYLGICFRYYNGEQYTSKKEERVSAAQELGRLNHILFAAKIHLRRDGRYAPLTEEDVDKIRQECLKTKAFDRKVLNTIDWLQEITANIFLQFPADHRSYLVQHADYHPANLLFKNGQVLAILDFDSLISLPKNQSVAFACDRFSESMEDMYEFIHTYRNTEDTLTAEDVKRFPDLIKREALCRINYILRSYYFQKRNIWNFEFDKHVETIRRMNCIREQFVNI